MVELIQGKDKLLVRIPAPEFGYYEATLLQKKGLFVYSDCRKILPHKRYETLQTLARYSQGEAVSDLRQFVRDFTT